MPDVIDIEIAVALAERQWLIPITVPSGSCAGEVVADALQTRDFEGVVTENLQIGVWGQVVEADHVLQQGDRVELYRPLEIDPQIERRRLAKAGRTMGAGAPGGKREPGLR